MRVLRAGKKQLTLKFWQEEHLAINVVYLTTIILFVFPRQAQAQNPEQKAYYSVITHIISQDTVISNRVYEYLGDKVKKGKMSSQDSLKYVNSVKERALNLSVKTDNESIKSALVDELKKSKEGKSIWLDTSLKKYNANLENIIKKIPNNKLHESKMVDPRIRLISLDEEAESIHYFSSPIKIGKNRYLIYHSYYGGFNISKVNYYLFSVDEDGGFKDLNWEQGHFS